MRHRSKPLHLGLNADKLAASENIRWIDWMSKENTAHSSINSSIDSKHPPSASCATNNNMMSEKDTFLAIRSRCTENCTVIVDDLNSLFDCSDNTTSVYDLCVYLKSLCTSLKCRVVCLIHSDVDDYLPVQSAIE
eukprot:1149970_1